jgi:hypothetical protein
MERPNPTPALVPADASGQAFAALIVPDRQTGRPGRTSPFAGLVWRLMPDPARRAEPPRRPHAGA